MNKGFAGTVGAMALALVGCSDLSDMIFGEVRTTRLNVTPPPVTTELDCRTECKIGSETENCLYLNASVSRPDYKTRIAAFRALFNAHAQDASIPHAEVLALFDSPDDPCRRGEVLLGQDGVFTNLSTDSTHCYLSYKAPLVGELMLDVPPKITGAIIDTEAGGFDIRFDKPEEAIEMIFAKQALNNDIGGKIVAVNVLANRVLMRTQTMCLASAI